MSFRWILYLLASSAVSDVPAVGIFLQVVQLSLVSNPLGRNHHCFRLISKHYVPSFGSTKLLLLNKCHNIETRSSRRYSADRFCRLCAVLFSTSRHRFQPGNLCRDTTRLFTAALFKKKDLEEYCSKRHRVATSLSIQSAVQSVPEPDPLQRRS